MDRRLCAAVVVALFHGYNYAAGGGDSMKVIERKPLRHRGRSEEKRQATKEAIRDVYANGPQKAVQIIPAKKDLMPEGEKKKLRVCAYCRVSTDEDNQASSYYFPETSNIYYLTSKDYPKIDVAEHFASVFDTGAPSIIEEDYILYLIR